MKQWMLFLLFHYLLPQEGNLQCPRYPPLLLPFFRQP